MLQEENTRYRGTLQVGVIRLIDIISALIGGMLALPLIIVIEILVRRDSPGPALFGQQRVGRRQTVFTCYKIRTMVQGTRAAGTHEMSSSSLTPLGRRLRHWKLDELPQLWNVLRREMSLVGPRPCLPSQVELVEERQRRGVYEVRPGIAGSVQVEGLDMSTPVALAIEDAHWAEYPNLKDYFRLIFLTVLGKGSGDAIRR